MTAMTERRRLLMIGPLPPGLRAALAERYELDALWGNPTATPGCAHRAAATRAA